MKKSTESDVILTDLSSSNKNIKFCIFTLVFLFFRLHVVTIQKLLCTLPICCNSPKSVMFLLGWEVKLVTRLSCSRVWEHDWNLATGTWVEATMSLLRPGSDLKICHAHGSYPQLPSEVRRTKDHMMETARSFLKWPCGTRKTDIRLWCKWG